MRTFTLLIGLLILGISACAARPYGDPGIQNHYEAHQLPRCIDATRPEVVGLDLVNSVEGNFSPTISRTIKTVVEFEGSIHHSPLPLIPRIFIKIRVLRN